jgi:hypothetical protein
MEFLRTVVEDCENAIRFTRAMKSARSASTLRDVPQLLANLRNLIVTDSDQIPQDDDEWISCLYAINKLISPYFGQAPDFMKSPAIDVIVDCLRHFCPASRVSVQFDGLALDDYESGVVVWVSDLDGNQSDQLPLPRAATKSAVLDYFGVMTDADSIEACCETHGDEADCEQSEIPETSFKGTYHPQYGVYSPPPPEPEDLWVDDIQSDADDDALIPQQVHSPPYEPPEFVPESPVHGYLAPPASPAHHHLHVYGIDQDGYNAWQAAVYDPWEIQQVQENLWGNLVGPESPSTPEMDESTPTCRKRKIPEDFLDSHDPLDWDEI